MARPPAAGIRWAVACAVLSAPWMVAGPAQAGAGDLVDGAAAVPGAADEAVARVTGSPDAVVEDVVRQVTRQPEQQAAGSTPQDDHASTTHTSPAGSHAPSNREAAPDRPAQELTPAEEKRTPRARPAYDDPVDRAPVVEAASRRSAAAPSPRVADACESSSLAARDLRRCARATTSLPGLGGVPVTLLPAGLVMVAAGLVLVARGRRRRTHVRPAG